ncbi:MAG: alanine racemase [Lachnospiraceae bacterium]|nr:alanine racemase [Lachnospiraceae bacterium]
MDTELSYGYDRRRVWAEVDLTALDFNIDSITKCLPASTRLTAVVKADAYGHGAREIAKHLESVNAVYGYAVATADEAFALCDAGAKKPVMLLGYTFPESFERIVLEKIRPAVFREDTLTQYEAVVSSLHKSGDLVENETVRVHIAVDCGMRRIGVQPDETGLQFVKKALATKGVTVEGIFTHFSRADEKDLSCAEEELSRFTRFVEQVRALDGGEELMVHASNSAAIVTLSKAHLDMVRAGIVLYGLYPSDEVDRDKLPLKPVLSLKSSVVYVKELVAGCAVSYGGTFVTDQKMRVATVCAGYADGVARTLSGKGEVLVRGKRAPILGRVCMDQFMIDVTDIPDVTMGDTVTIIGRDGAEEISMDEIALKSGRFHYEFPCLIPPRVPRVVK